MTDVNSATGATTSPDLSELNEFVQKNSMVSLRGFDLAQLVKVTWTSKDAHDGSGEDMITLFDNNKQWACISLDNEDLFDDPNWLKLNKYIRDRVRGGSASTTPMYEWLR